MLFGIEEVFKLPLIHLRKLLDCFYNLLNMLTVTAQRLQFV